MSHPDEQDARWRLTDEQQALIDGLRQDAVNRYQDGDRGAIAHSVAMNPSDPAFLLLLAGKRSVPVVHDENCYICRDPEFAAMGMSLCSPCPDCLRRQVKCPACQGAASLPGGAPCAECQAAGWTGPMGHIPADDAACTVCPGGHGPDDYDSEGLITGLDRERAIEIRDMRRRQS